MGGGWELEWRRAGRSLAISRKKLECWDRVVDWLVAIADDMKWGNGVPVGRVSSEGLAANNRS